MKTVYRFYQKYSDDILKANNNLRIEDKYPLYALTNNKKLAKEFIKQRNMDKFILRKSKMDKDDYVYFANKNSSAILKAYKYTCYDRNNNNKETDIEIVSTWNEKEIVSAIQEDSAGIDSMVTYETVPFIFTKKYLKALDTIAYASFWKLYGNSERYMDLLTDEEQELIDDYSFPDIKYDELYIFINIHGSTMN